MELKDAIALAEGDDGSLWIATNNHILRAQINKNYPFHVERWDVYNSSNGLDADEILAIAKDADGNIWVGTDRGVFLFDGGNWTARKGGLLLENSVTAIYSDSSQRLWFGIRNTNGQTAVCCFDGQDWEKTQALPTSFVFVQLDGLPSGYICAIAEDKAENIWVATPNGAGRFDGKRWDTLTSTDGLADDNVQTIMAAADGCIWFGMPNGVSIVRGTEVFDKRSWRKLTTSDGLVSNNIQAICEDKNGGIWLGTHGRGVKFTDRMWQTFTTESGLPDNLITAIGEDGEHNIWVGTPNGLCKYNKDTVDECWEIFTNVPSNSIRSITTAKDGGLWIGTDKGILHYDGIGSRTYTKQQDGLSNDSIHAIELDMAGNVWVGVGISGVDWFGKLHKFDGTQWEDYTTDATVSSLLFDSSGILWVGTFRHGVLVGEELKPVDGLASNAVSAIIEDANGNIWIGTANGISVWMRTNSKQIGNFINLTTDQGLVDNNVQSLFMAGDGRIWVGTSDGVSIFEKTQNQSPIFNIQYSVTKGDGLASNDIGVIFESNDGSIWLGSNDKKGLTRWEIERVEPRTRITGGPVGTIDTIDVRFEFEGGDASTSTEGLSYFYQLKYSSFLEEGWTKQKYVNFPGLKDREDYVFTVKARDRDGNIDNIGDSAIFHIDVEYPEARIDKPTRNQVIGGTFDIEGTATDNTDFWKYEISGPKFSYVYEDEVENGVLARWNTREVRDGKYSITLSVWDSKDGEFDNSHKTSPEPVPIVVDNTKPKVQILQPQTGYIVPSPQVEIIGEIEDEHPKSYMLEYSHASSEWKEIHSEFSEGTRVKYSWDSSRIYGKTILRLRAVDEAGNQGLSDDITITLENDSALPRVEISMPIEEQVLSGTVSITGTVSSDTPLEKFVLEYKSQTSDWIVIEEGYHAIEGESIAHWDTTKLVDGIYKVKLSAKDNNGYLNNDTRTIIIDNTKPTATIKYPADGSTISSSANTEILGDAFDDNFERYILEYAKRGVDEEWAKLSENSKQGHNEILGEWYTLGRSGQYLLKLTVWDKANLDNSDTVEINLDDKPPIASISNPQRDGTIVSDYVEIHGTAMDETDDNFQNYIIFVKSEGDDEWSEICNETTPKEDSILVVWDTRGKNGVYVVKLEVWDKTGHSTGEASPLRTVIVDNKKPISMIKEPTDYQQVSGEVRLMGTAYDENFDTYTIEYGEDANPKKWDTISETPFLQSVQDNLLAVWQIPAGKTGIHTLRLIVFDKVGHQSDESKITVVISLIIPRSTGGKASDNNGTTTIIIPPNSLEKDTAITINPVNDLGGDFNSSGKVDIACDVLPAIRLNRIKPATIIISYSNEISDDETLALFFYNGSVFQNIGGTVDKKQKTVAAPVTRLGRYALMRIKSEPQDNASISFLTCQPRIFSPQNGSGAALSRQTRISFTLNQPTEVTIKIYNVAGKLKRILKEKDIMYKGGNNLAWDGRDEDGKIVPGGAYIVTVTTNDNVAHKSVFVWNN